MKNDTLVGGMVTCFELNRCEVLEARMRSDVVVAPTPAFDQDGWVTRVMVLLLSSVRGCQSTLLPGSHHHVLVNG